jgi:hypothetical protein
MTADLANQKSSPGGLTIFEARDLENWQDRLACIVNRMRFAYAKSKYGLTIWNPKDISNLTYGWNYEAAWRVTREGFGRDKYGLGVKSVRVYFQGNSTEPTAVPENVLSKFRYKAPSLPRVRISHAKEFGVIFGGRFPGLNSDPVCFVIDDNMTDHTKLVCDGDRAVSITEKHWESVRNQGFLRLPLDFEVFVVSEKNTDPVCDEYSGVLANTMDKFGVNGSVSRKSYKDIWELLDKNTNPDSKLKGRALLIGLNGQAGDGLSKEEARLMEELECRGIAFRMFSKQNPQLRFSGFNQLSDLILVAGGTPYELSLPWPEDLKRNPFIVGVDLGHPLAGQSILCLTLSDSRGNLIKSWRSEQERDETADPSTLIRLLGLAKFEMKRISGREESPVLVIRDGRIHAGENVATYRSHLSKELSFCDLSKRPNAHPFSEESNLAKAGTAYFPQFSASAYFVSSPPIFEGQMTTLQKVHFPRSWDGLEIGLERLVQILVGLSYSPCLGMRPHKSPGPVHWADGFASISATNCKFRGLGCVESQKRTVKLRGKPLPRKVTKPERVFIGSSGSSTGVEGWEDPYRPSCKAILPKPKKI